MVAFLLILHEAVYTRACKGQRLIREVALKVTIAQSDNTMLNKKKYLNRVICFGNAPKCNNVSK